MDQAEQEIRDIQQGWMDAASRRVEPALRAILGDEYVLISARLGIVDREGWLAMGPAPGGWVVVSPQRIVREPLTVGTGRRRAVGAERTH